MESLSDRFTKRQIIDYNSQLNKRGLDIRAELERNVNKPVYYLLCNPIGGWFEFEKNNKNLTACPKCNGEFSKIDNAYADKDKSDEQGEDRIEVADTSDCFDSVYNGIAIIPSADT